MENIRTTKSTEAVARGARNKALGAEHEARIDRACEYYFAHNAAKIEKTPEPMKILKSIGEGQFEAVFAKAAQPDYKGCIRGGRTVVFEAKFTTTERMLASVVSEEQAKSLNEYASLGAICFVIAGFSSGNTYRIPWAVWCEMKTTFGHKYFTESEAAKYRLTNRDGILAFLGDTIGRA